MLESGGRKFPGQPSPDWTPVLLPRLESGSWPFPGLKGKITAEDVEAGAGAFHGWDFTAGISLRGFKREVVTGGH